MADSNNLFGGSDIFNPKPPQQLQSDLFGGSNLFAHDGGAKLSSTAQEALQHANEIDKVAQQNAQQVQQAVAESQRRDAERARLYQQMALEAQRLTEAKRKAEEKAKKEAEKAKKEQEKQEKKLLETDSAVLIKADLDALMGSEGYKNAGDLRRRSLADEYRTVLEERLQARGHSEEAIKKSLRAYDAHIEADIKKLKSQEAGLGGTLSDIGKSISATWSSWRGADDEEEAGQITSAHRDLLAGKVASGWEVEEMLERDPSIAKYLEKDRNLGFASLSSFKLRSDLTASQKQEFNRKAEQVFASAKSSADSHYAKQKSAYNSVSAEQMRERDNYAYELEQLDKKYDGNGGIFQSLESAMITLRYPATVSTDQAGNLVVGAGATLAESGAVALGSALATTGVGTAPGGAVVAINSARLAKRVGKVFDFLAKPSLAGAIVSAELTQADIISSVRDEIANTDIETLRKAPEWQELVRMSGGNEELAKQRLVSMKANDDTTTAYLIALAAGAVGPEALAGRIISKATVGRGAVASTARNTGRNIAGAVGVGAVAATAEGFEEGYTQYTTNQILRSVGVDIDSMEGVWSAAGQGIGVGGLIGGVGVAQSAISGYRGGKKQQEKATVAGTFTEENITAKTNQYQQQGQVDFDGLKKTVITDVQDLVNSAKEIAGSDPAPTTSLAQAYYNEIVDNDAVRASLTDSQQQELARLFNATWQGVNTNPYAKAQSTPTMTAIANGDVMPSDPIMADVWRIIHKKDEANIKAPELAHVVANIFTTLNAQHGEETTRERAGRYQTLREELRSSNPNIPLSEWDNIDAYVYKNFDAGMRRDGDQETTINSDGEQGAVQGNAQDSTSQSTGADGQSQEREETTTEQPNAGNESGGDGSTRQENQPTSGTAPDTTTGAGNERSDRRPGETQNAQQNTDDTTTPGATGQTPTSQGSDGQTSQGGQSARPADTTTKSKAKGGRKSRASSAKRLTDNERLEAITQEIGNLSSGHRRAVTAYVKAKEGSDGNFTDSQMATVIDPVIQALQDTNQPAKEVVKPFADGLDIKAQTLNAFANATAKIAKNISRGASNANTNQTDTTQSEQETQSDRTNISQDDGAGTTSERSVGSETESTTGATTESTAREVTDSQSEQSDGPIKKAINKVKNLVSKKKRSNDEKENTNSQSATNAQTTTASGDENTVRSDTSTNDETTTVRRENQENDSQQGQVENEPSATTTDNPSASAGTTTDTDAGTATTGATTDTDSQSSTSKPKPVKRQQKGKGKGKGKKIYYTKKRPSETNFDELAPKQRPVVITAEVIKNSESLGKLAYEPEIASIPGAIDGEVTDQVANIDPIIVDGKSVTQVFVPKGQYTEAEQTADGSFDTEPVTETTEDGLGVADITASIVETLKGKGEQNDDTDANTDGTGADDGDTSGDTTQADDSEYTAEDKTKLKSKKKAKVEKEPLPGAEAYVRIADNALSKAVRDSLHEQVAKQDNSRAEWLLYLLNGNGGDISEFINTMSDLQYSFDMAMADNAFAQSRVRSNDYWVWNKARIKKFNEGKTGSLFGPRALVQWVMSHYAGISHALDDLMNSYTDADGYGTVPRSGTSQDSSVVSVAFAKMRSKGSSIYGIMERRYLRPVTKAMRNLADSKYVDHNDVVEEFGLYANMRHTYEEGADALFRSLEKTSEIFSTEAERHMDIIRNAKIDDAKAHTAIIKAAESNSIKEFNKLTKELDAGLRDELRIALRAYNANTDSASRAERNRERMMAVYNGEESREKYPNIDLPDGYTKTELEQAMALMEAKYDKQDLVEMSEMIYDAIRNMRTYGQAHGAFSTQDIENYNEIGFKRYVPLWHKKDGTDIDTQIELNENIEQSVFDEYLSDDPDIQVRSTGLSRDLSRYYRQGSTSHAQDAFTNMYKFAMYSSSRAGEAEFRQSIQGVFENTLWGDGTPPTTAPSVNVLDNGLVETSEASPGIIRIRGDLSKAVRGKILPKELKEATPLQGKGWAIDRNGELVEIPYDYYFTDTAVRNEVTQTVSLTKDGLLKTAAKGLAALTRTQSRLFTSHNPMWNVWNFFREAYERAGIIMFRPVTNENGERINRYALFSSFTRNLTQLSTDLSLQDEIFDYLRTRKAKTPIQRELEQLYTEGTVSLHTDVIERFDHIDPKSKLALHDYVNRVRKKARRLEAKTGINKVVDKVDDAHDWYIMRIAETPQVVNALAMYRAYKDNNVNSREAHHRVRDAFDPMRTRSTFVQGLSYLFPFIRSTGAGHYNTSRNIGDAFRDDPRGILTLGTIVAGGVLVLNATSQFLGDDENGDPLIWSLPASDLERGIPVVVNGNILYSPIGHGFASMMWALSVHISRAMAGVEEPKDAMESMFSHFIKNTSPIALPSPEAISRGGLEPMLVSLLPSMIQPIVEVILNVSAYSGNRLHNDYPTTDPDHLGGKFTTPEAYKGYAKWLYDATGGLVDAYPESLQHLMKRYVAIGPLRGFEVARQDKAEKTGGVFVNKDEKFGELLTMVGMGMGWDTNTLGAESRYFKMRKQRDDIIKKYGVPATQSKNEEATPDIVLDGVDYDNAEDGSRARRLANDLAVAGATEHEIQFVINAELAERERRKAKKKMEDTYKKYASDSKEVSYAEVTLSAEELLAVYNDFIRENLALYKEVK